MHVRVGAGDVLYLPAYWFHFIVSLEPNAQCNARSGTPPHGEREVQACFMPVQRSEEAGKRTAQLGAPPPPHHLAAEKAGGGGAEAPSLLPWDAAAAGVAAAGAGAAQVPPASSQRVDTPPLLAHLSPSPRLDAAAVATVTAAAAPHSDSGDLLSMRAALFVAGGVCVAAALAIRFGPTVAAAAACPVKARGGGAQRRRVEFAAAARPAVALVGQSLRSLGSRAGRGSFHG